MHWKDHRKWLTNAGKTQISGTVCVFICKIVVAIRYDLHLYCFFFYFSFSETENHSLEMSDHANRFQFCLVCEMKSWLQFWVKKCHKCQICIVNHTKAQIYILFSFVTSQIDDKSILTVHEEQPGENEPSDEGVCSILEQDLGDSKNRSSGISGRNIYIGRKMCILHIFSLFQDRVEMVINVWLVV